MGTNDCCAMLGCINDSFNDSFSNGLSGFTVDFITQHASLQGLLQLSSFNGQLLLNIFIVPLLSVPVLGKQREKVRETQLEYVHCSQTYLTA